MAKINFIFIIISPEILKCSPEAVIPYFYITQAPYSPTPGFEWAIANIL